MPVDSATVEMFSRMGTAFGVPVGWLIAGAGGVIGLVNTLKTLAPNLLASSWYPAVGALGSAVYAYATLGPSWVAVIAGALLLFGIQWLLWAGAKTAAAKAGMRDA